MQKTLYILITIAMLGMIAVYTVPKINKQGGSTANDTVVVAATLAPTPTPTKSAVSTTTTVTPSLTSTPVSVSGALKDGTYTGSSSSNRYGVVQVAITIGSGQITDVNFLQVPDSDSHSASISNYAKPLLKQETLTAQSATIDTVSGATYTSNSYKQSLQSAIDLAKA